MISHCSFNLHFSNSEQCWTYFHVSIGHMYILRNVSLGLLPIFWLGCLLFWYWVICLCILKINHLSVISFVIILSHSEDGLLSIFIVFFVVQMLFKFNYVPFAQFFFFFSISITLGGQSKSNFLWFMSKTVLSFPLRAL